jgi:hypothetical protein
LDTRTSTIPIDHQLAEIIAYPIASVAAFSRPFEVLSFSDPSFANLWRRAESEFLSTVPNISVDEITSLRDHLWFRGFAKNPTGKIPLHRYCWDFTNRLLDTNTGFSLPRLTPEYLGNDKFDSGYPDVLARIAWRWLTFALPTDFLLVAQDPLRVPLSHCRQSDVPSPLLTRNLGDKGFSESHLHGKAAINFSRLWIALLRQLGNDQFPSSSFKSPGAIFEEGKSWGDWLIRLGIVRQLLGWFLSSRARNPNRDFSTFLGTDVRRFILTQRSVSDLAVVNSALLDVHDGQLSSINSIAYSGFQSLYKGLSSVFNSSFAKDLLSLYSCDPLADRLTPIVDLDISCEQLLVRRGMGYIQSKSIASTSHGTKPFECDPVFARLFWQVIRLRNLFYRHITQRPMTPGLQYFIRFYDRISPARKPMKSRLLCESILKTSGLEQGLRSLEIRTCPDPNFSETYNFIRDYTYYMDQLAPVDTYKDFEFGIVLHLSKERGGQYGDGLPQPHWEGTNADPVSSANSARYRYANYFNTKLNEVLAIQNAIVQFPASLKVLRGFDVCTDEMAVPPWVLKPFFGYLDRLCGRVINYWKCYNNEQLTLPRKTVHCGEDFVHIMTGMRSIWESIEHFGLQDGDRLGHGSALGYDIPGWAARMYRLSMAREVRFFDLLWEWRCYIKHHAPFLPERIEWIKTELRAHAYEIFGIKCTVEELSRFYDQLHDVRVLASAGFPNTRAVVMSQVSKKYELFYMYLTDRGCFRRCKENIWVPTQSEVPAMEGLQRFLRQRVSSMGLTVEINPSSNLLIGNLSDLTNHPLWRMRHPDGNRDIAPLRVCVGSDDPITFATRLPNEYLLLHDAMINAGLGSHVADEWIESARQAGMNARFTLKDWRVKLPPWNPTSQPGQPLPWAPTMDIGTILSGLEPILPEDLSLRRQIFDCT